MFVGLIKDQQLARIPSPYFIADAYFTSLRTLGYDQSQMNIYECLGNAAMRWNMCVGFEDREERDDYPPAARK